MRLASARATAPEAFARGRVHVRHAGLPIRSAVPVRRRRPLHASGKRAASRRAGIASGRLLSATEPARWSMSDTIRSSSTTRPAWTQP